MEDDNIIEDEYLIFDDTELEMLLKTEQDDYFN